MSGKQFLLDTNIIIDLFKRDADLIAQIPNIKHPFVSTITIGELYYGALNSSNPKKHIKQIEDFHSICQIVEVGTETAKFYGEIKTQLRKNGTPIPENDIWLSASTLENGFILITKDKHFKKVEKIGLLFIE